MVGYYVKRTHIEELEKLTHPISSDMWIDSPDSTSDQLANLVDTYGLNTNIINDVKDKQELSRLEFSGNDAYVFIRAPILNTSGRVVTHPVLCIVSNKNFFTLSLKSTVDPEAMAKNLSVRSMRHGIDMLVGVIASCVAQYEEALKHTERSIDDTGSRLRTREINNQDFVHFVVVEDNLTACRMNLSGMAATLRRIHDTSHDFLTPRHMESIDDISLHVQQLLGAVESYAGRVESIRNAYSTVANNTLNQRMKTLTVFTVMIALPNLIYGMYGMNVTGLPYHDQPWAYVFVLATSAVVTGGLYLVAKLFRVF